MPTPSVVTTSLTPASVEVFSHSTVGPTVYLVVTDMWSDRTGVVLTPDEARAVAAALVAHADALT